MLQGSDRAENDGHLPQLHVAQRDCVSHAFLEAHHRLATRGSAEPIHSLHGRMQDFPKVAIHGNAFVGPTRVNDQASLASIDRGRHRQGVRLRSLQLDQSVAVAPQSLKREVSAGRDSEKTDCRTWEKQQCNPFAKMSCRESRR
jgi:hypothetical protein